MEPKENAFLDCAGWQAMLEREDIPATSAWVGVLRRADFASHRGTLLVWRGEGEGEGENGAIHVSTALREYESAAGPDVALLLVVDNDAVSTLRAEGLASMQALVRQGKLHPYVLKTMNQLEDAGLSDFVEDLGLVFPKH